MGIYIKGMRMPPIGQSIRLFRTSKGDFVNIFDYEERYEVSEVKVPHGDLIDRNELFKWHTGQRTKYPIKKETPQYETIMMYEVFDEIDDAEAVIEAEVE